MISVSESLYRGRARAQQHQFVVGCRPQLVRGARRYHDAIPGDDVALVGPERMRPRPEHASMQTAALTAWWRISSGALPDSRR